MEAVDRGSRPPRARWARAARASSSRVTLPLALPGVVTGVLLSFARSLGEFGATITFVSNIPGETQTLPLAIYTYTQVPGRRRAGAAAVRSSRSLLSLAALMASEWLVRRATSRAAGRDA